MLLPIFFTYAEIHYHLKKLFPLYYKKFPEIIADIPLRCIINKNRFLPVLIIIKDSHLFPVELKQVKVSFLGKDKKINRVFKLNEKVDLPYYSRLLQIPLEQIETGDKLIDVEFQIRRGGRDHLFLNDNYDLPYQPFKCYLTEEPLPYPVNWFAGEPHYHSNYTTDQVEFGADIPVTMEMAKAQGLNWFFVTDHSYDLDDSLDNYTRNDPQLPKWKKLQEEIKNLPESELKVIPGEEISIGNCRKKNVHLLALNHAEFIAGKGDGAEKWFANKPETFIKDIAKLQDEKNLFIAAHPWEKVPFLQKLTLRRDIWHKEDFENGKIGFLQIVNGTDRAVLRESINHWTSLLLQGKKLIIVGGNDAHGNFNIMRQIKIPFIKLFSNREQIFGRFLTVFNYPDNDPIAGIKQGKVIVTNGPFLNFEVSANKVKYDIGAIIPAGKYDFNYQTATTTEFGTVKKAQLYKGNILTGEEKQITPAGAGNGLELQGRGYLRMEMETELGGLVLTNPLWFRD